MHSLVGWAKALARRFPDSKDSRAPCPRCHNSQLRKNAWARRTRDFAKRKGSARAFAHPTILFLAKRTHRSKSSFKDNVLCCLSRIAATPASILRHEPPAYPPALEHRLD